MSFKREGNDHGLLMNLKRRRVSELLANHIPEDEAILLKNGRYSCSVCHHRPIFDTLSVLAIHRKSKKHLQNLTHHLQKKEEVKELILKRQQEHYVKTNKRSTELEKAEKNLASLSKPALGLLKQPLYKSCSKNKKQKANIFARKNRIFFPENNEVEVGKVHCQEEKTAHTRTPNSIIRSYLKSLKRKKEFGSLVDKARTNHAPKINSLVKADNDVLKKSPEKELSLQKRTNINDTILPIRTTGEEQQKRASYYLNLRAKGWKKDTSGKWIADEDAEFDSDENEPLDYIEGNI